MGIMKCNNAIGGVRKPDFEIDEEKRPCTLSHQGEAVIYRRKVCNPREHSKRIKGNACSCFLFSSSELLLATPL